MEREIRVLMVEDIVADATLIQGALRAGGLVFRAKRVDSQESYVDELENRPPDIILSDHGLPAFTGFAALAIARKKCPEVPFVFVAGALCAETVIDTLKSGASDYVLKRHISTHLVSAVQRALREAEQRVQRKKAEAEWETLRHLLPMCPSCKKRREDEEYWKQLEKYFREHSDGASWLCPQCDSSLRHEAQ